MGGDGQRPAAELLDFQRHRLAGIELAAGDDDIGAGARKGQHHLAAEAAAAAGDKGDLAGEIEGIGHGGVPRLRFQILDPQGRLPPVLDFRFSIFALFSIPPGGGPVCER